MHYHFARLVRLAPRRRDKRYGGDMWQISLERFRRENPTMGGEG